MQNKPFFLRQLGVFGFDHVEPLILAALVSEDPILLIGKAGTGKTYLLNSISEALMLEHRHYNASLVSFDDLIGFPFPDQQQTHIRFLPTPATIWGCESVLIDELSRCKPEIQNKFFSIVHEKKIQGISLEKLRFRWAAMNPFVFSGDDSDDNYDGAQPLDAALADRFAFIIEVPDWPELCKEDQELVIQPDGEGKLSGENSELLHFIQRCQSDFHSQAAQPLSEVVDYVRIVSGLLCEAGLRMSPRRARLVARNITALLCVTQQENHVLSRDERSRLYKLALRWSLPHRAYKEQIADHSIDAVHADAKRIIFSDHESDAWVCDFLFIRSLSEKLNRIIKDPIDNDTKSIAVMQFLGRESKGRRAAFAFAAFPVISQYSILNAEATNELCALASAILRVEGKMEWREQISITNSVHPAWSECQKCLDGLPGENRKNRARQLFLYMIVNNYTIVNACLLEQELHNLFEKGNQLLPSPNQTPACPS